jgi:hypothetical protein
MSTSNVQRRLCESGRFAAKKPLLKHTNNNKILTWAKNHERWTLDRWKYVLWSGVQIGDGWIQPPYLCEMRCVFPSVKNGAGGVMMWGCLAGDTVCDLFRIQGTIKQHGYHSILQRYTVLSCLGLVGLSSVFQQDNDPTHLQAVYGIFYQEREWCSAASDDLASTIPRPQPNWHGLGWVRLQSEGNVANKCSAYVGTHSRWSWFREYQECTKLSSRQTVAIWRISNIKYILICLSLFWILHDSICVISHFLMYSLLLYSVGNS